MFRYLRNVCYFMYIVGLLYTYLAEGCSRRSSQGAFRALQRGYINWDSGHVDHLEINYRHPQFCHVRCKMVQSMKPGLYHVYMVLGKEGEFASRKQLPTVLQGKLFCQFCLPLIQELLSFCRESASCTHVSAVLLHALVAMSPPQLTGPRRDDTGGDDEALPVTSFACTWKQPRKRKYPANSGSLIPQGCVWTSCEAYPLFNR